MEVYESLPSVVQAFLANRSSKYGIAPHELIRKIPAHLHDNAIEIYKFMKGKDISHIKATSKGGSASDFNNWIFEDLAPNRSRGNDAMRIEEFLDAQLDNDIEAMGIEFGTPNPGTPGFNAAYKQAFGVGFEGEEIDPVLISEVINNPEVTSDVLWEGMGEALRDIGIPVGYLTFKVGFGGVIPFLRSINWQSFRDDARYRNKTLARALLAFRQGGWKETAKAFVIGFLIAAFPPLSYFMAAIGLTGIAAIGARWLANKLILVKGPFSFFLSIVSSALSSAHKFLKSVLAGFEKVVEVVIEAASNQAKKVISIAEEFVSSVRQVSTRIAKDLCEKVSGVIKNASRSIAGWVLSWFDSSFPAIA